MEVAAIVMVARDLAWIDWRWMLVAYVPTFYCGWFLALLENYYEHHHASNHRSRLADSVSYYGRWYNILMFNEGYHQEHHLKPHLHWTRRPGGASGVSGEFKTRARTKRACRRSWDSSTDALRPVRRAFGRSLAEQQPPQRPQIVEEDEARQDVVAKLI